MDDQEHIFVRHPTSHSLDEKWGLYATGAGRSLICEPGVDLLSKTPWDVTTTHGIPNTQSRTLPDFLLLWVGAGEGELDADDNVFDIMPGSVFVVPPLCKHVYRRMPGPGQHEYWVTFNGDFARQLVESGVMKSHTVVFEKLPAGSLRAGFEQLFEHMGQLPAVPSQLISADIFRLLALATTGETQATHCNQAGDLCNRLVADAVALIRSPRNQSISVDELVRQMVVARRTLERAFRSQLGHGIHEEILRCRIEKTRHLLADESLSIEEVAFKSGFGNARSLRRAFTAAEGISPQSFRRSLSSDSPILTERFISTPFDAL